MAWNHFLLNKVTNVTATLQDGGNLDANTTYYVKVLAIAKTTDTRQTSGWLNVAAHYSGEWSDTVTFTTTSTQRSVLLQWDRVYKHSGVEVEGYDVLVSKTGSFPHHGQILRAPSYVYPTTSNNYYLLDANANYYYRYVPYGFPYIWWSGTGTATPDNLYAYMKANIPNYERWVQTFSVPHLTTDNAIFGYNINACIEINRSDDDITYNDGHYTFDCKGRIFLVWGTFKLTGGKVKVTHSLIFTTGPGHSGGNNFLAPAADGSKILGSNFWAFIGDGTPASSGGIHFATSGAGRLWGGADQASGKVTANEHDTFLANIIDWPADAPVLGNEYPRDLFIVGHPDKVPGQVYYKSSPFLSKVITNLKIGALNNLVVANAYWWVPTASNCNIAPGSYVVEGISGGMDGCVQWSYWLGYMVNFYFKYNDVGYTLYPKLNLSRSPDFLYCKGYLAKTIKVKVLGENGNPISGAKVYFYGPNNEKLTIGNSISQIVSFDIPQRIVGYNYDPNNQNPTYDTTNLWVYYYSYSAGKVISELEAGQEYFIMGERIKVIRKLDETPPATNWQLYEVERGVSGIRSGWLSTTSSHTSYHHLLEAPDYHTTDENGETWNITMWADYRLEQTGGTIIKHISELVADGILSEKLYLPVKIRVEAEGYQTFETYVGYDEFLASKNDHLYVVIKLPDQVKLLMPMGKRIYKNLKPSDGQNKILWEEI